MKRFVTRIRYPESISQIEVGSGIAAASEMRRIGKNYSSIHFIIDANVARLHGAGVLKALLGGSDFFALAAGENQKNIRKAEQILAWLHDSGADRKSLLVAVGGGVTTDLAGFAASTYMRGIDYISLPTTLVGQVDASIGGKTAINLGGTKNLAGTFYPPRRIVCDNAFLATLRSAQIRDGLVEAVKIFAARDAAAFRRHAELLRSYVTGENMSELIADAIRLKVAAVNADPFERDLRRVLNFGHTTGHAYEAITRQSHGKSVAFGILVALVISRRQAQLNAADFESIWVAITQLYRKFAVAGIDAQALWERIQHDKKKTGAKVNFVLLKRCGEHIVKSVNYPQFASALKETRRLLEA